MSGQANTYGLADMVDGLRRAGAAPGALLFVQSSLGMLGVAEGCRSTEDLCALFHTALREAVEPEGTLVVPTYSYSFCEGRSFDPGSTPSTIGPFPEFFRGLPTTVRSADPIFSVSAEGPLAEEIVTDLPHDCFGPGSVYDRLTESGAVILTAGVSLRYATYRHYVEQLAEIPARYLKRFSGTVEEAGAGRTESWNYFVPALLDACESEGGRAEQIAVDEGHCAVAPVGRGFLWGIPAPAYRDLLLRMLAADPWATVRGPQLDVVEAERERAGVSEIEVPDFSASDAPMERLGDFLAPLSREAVSAGARAALRALDRLLGLRVHEFRTGSRAAGWVVPENIHRDGAAAVASCDVMLAGDWRADGGGDKLIVAGFGAAAGDGPGACLEIAADCRDGTLEPGTDVLFVPDHRAVLLVASGDVRRFEAYAEISFAGADADPDDPGAPAGQARSGLVETLGVQARIGKS